MKPRIIGPRSWPAAAPPPRFSVDAAGMPLYMVELAAARSLMRTVTDRTRDNYFFGGDGESAFATGPGWRVPVPVWQRLGRTPVLYYRVIAYDQVAGRSEPSVDDQHLCALPTLVIEGVAQEN